MRLAVELGVDEYPVPGGGCLLTEQSYIPKVQDLLDHQTVPLVRDFELLRTGRHFRLSERCKAVVGRDNSDNEKILAIAGSGETTLRWLDGASPLVLMVGEADETAIRQAGRILLRYTKSPKGETGCISVQRDGKRSEISVVHDLDENELERLRI
jgi:hypothetical protein